MVKEIKEPATYVDLCMRRYEDNELLNLLRGKQLLEHIFSRAMKVSQGGEEGRYKPLGVSLQVELGTTARPFNQAKVSTNLAAIGAELDVRVIIRESRGVFVLVIVEEHWLEGDEIITVFDAGNRKEFAAGYVQRQLRKTDTAYSVMKHHRGVAASGGRRIETYLSVPLMQGGVR